MFKKKHKISNKNDSIFFGFARNILREYWRKIDQGIGNPFGSDKPEDEQEDEITDEQRSNCMRQCFNKLMPNQQDLMKKYCSYEKGEKIKTRLRLALQLGSNLNQLRIRVHRIRVILRNCFGECMKSILSQA